jgi:two-component system, NtrC family, response regulator AtoC
LLRFLGERTFERVGSNKTISADVRLITATNKKLEELVKAGTFREDLYYRLKVVEIQLPALRERRRDIPLLAQTFMQEFAQENQKAVRDFAPEAMEALLQYPFPGNVRELRSALEHAVLFCRGDKIVLRDLPAEIRHVAEPHAAAAAQTPPADELNIKEAKKQLIIRALKECDGNRSVAAEKLGMSRRSLHRKLHIYHLEGF